MEFIQVPFELRTFTYPPGWPDKVSDQVRQHVEAHLKQHEAAQARRRRTWEKTCRVAGCSNPRPHAKPAAAGCKVNRRERHSLFCTAHRGLRRQLGIGQLNRLRSDSGLRVSL